MTKFATFLIMFVFWVVLSGMFDGFHLSLGILSCLLVAHFSHDLLFVNRSVGSFTRHLIGWIFYVPYLLKEIILASVQVAYIVLHPRMLDLIDPQLIRFKTRLKRPVSRVSFAQSITLTPGTITVSVHDDEFTVYALTRSAAESLPGTMEEKVAAALEKEPL
jgi:multicomponent Na+:H+ antiporter subunit E